MSNLSEYQGFPFHDCSNRFWFFLFFSFLLIQLDDKDQKKSQKVLVELENIDDECDQNDIAFVKIDDDKEADEWGIEEIPTIVSSCVDNTKNIIEIRFLSEGFLRTRNSTHL